MERRLPTRLVPPLVALTFTTGIVDAVSYLGLGRVFTANMTGNVVLLGFALGGTHGFDVGALTVSLAAFLAGGLLGGRLAVRFAGRPGRLLARACAFEAVVVAVACATAAGLHPDTHERRRYAVIAVLGVAMGARNVHVRAMGARDFSTTV